MQNPITAEAVEQTMKQIAPHVVETPVIEWRDISERCGAGAAKVYCKLELWQRSGTFKARGALANMLAMDAEQKARGVTAVSAGNHAVAVAYAARAAGTSAKVVMLRSANPMRRRLAEEFGAQVLIAADGPEGFALAEEIAEAERRRFIHPFASVPTVLGTATLGLELSRQQPSLDAVIIAIGGGGLAGGASAMLKALQPGCEIIGVEPQGAACMLRSFESGRPERLAAPRTIADSLAPPMTLELPFTLCKDNISKIVTVTDEDLVDAMRLIFNDLKLAVEPACAAATAAFLKHASDFSGKKVGLVFCGSNIDSRSFCSLVAADSG